jgi:hypothetical protein
MRAGFLLKALYEDTDDSCRLSKYSSQSAYGRFPFPISIEVLRGAATANTRVIPAAARRALPVNTAPLHRTAAKKQGLLLLTRDEPHH